MTGVPRLGSAVLGGVYFDTPSVSVTAPTSEQVITSGGPEVTVSWTYTQPQGVAQTWYRAVFTNDAGTTTYYDTGWISGAATSMTVDLTENGIPTDSTDVSVTVYVSSAPSTNDGFYYQGSSALRPFQMQWGVPSVTIDDPTAHEEITTSTVTVAWTFSSTRSKTQSEWRVRLISQDGSLVLYDSGWNAGTDASYAVPYVLSDGSTYQAGVRVRNSEGVYS